ncbi:hypothetical protein DSOL_0967 [Desulfosporosinus metallidurans]|uniref:(2Fe-2S)-binding protein n=1 Tax=Desulfosporosinus metallidurans TaxID=1888891 RepID=A0A1Q8R1D5_9FIRM|nr:hypothetical protein DSOL_0967 [Desulfosporosinus metallidurans]
MQVTLKPAQLSVPSCPVCGIPGQRVRKVTVVHQVLPTVELPDDEKGYFLCRTSECQTAYYHSDGAIYWQNQLKNKIWFKQVEPPVPICYCLNVTEEEILRHVAVEKCCSSLEDIQKHTGANTGRECLTKNPAGG